MNSALSTREKAVELANELVEDCNIQLRAKIAYRRSVLMRLKGDVVCSQQIIQTFLSSLSSSANSLYVEDLASLYISQANNYAYYLRFQEAHMEAQRWAPRQDCLVLWDHVLCVGRLMRGQGNFQAAKTCFETCLQSPDLPKSKRLLVKSALADVYCELDEAIEEASYLLRAEDLVRPEIEQFRQSAARTSKGFRRLLMALLEIEIKKSNHGDAGVLVCELLNQFTSLEEPDIVDRLGHVRTLVAFARLSPTWEESLSRWNNVLIWGRHYNPQDEDVFMCGVVYLFLCLAWYHLGHAEKSKEIFQVAMNVIAKRRHQYFIPGVGTYLFRGIYSQVQSMTGWMELGGVCIPSYQLT